MRYLLVLLLSGCGTFEANPKYSRVVVTWDVVEEEQVSEKCGFNATACAKWRGNKCTIITPRETTMETLGHELRHCFEGHWHN
jgi:hypothetical protein